MMSELKVLEREDRTRRQKAISVMPVRYSAVHMLGYRYSILTACLVLVLLQSNLFQPVQQRLEMASEQQRDMEQAFEKLLLRTRGELNYLCMYLHTVHICTLVVDTRWDQPLILAEWVESSY